jgi:glyoxylase-like metal-dependent hydrolase (beta-lactamase superfamily II)
MDERVLESCLLDLLVDEEEPEDLDDWARERGWITLCDRARERVAKVQRSDKETCWQFSDFVLKSGFNDPLQLADWFLNMKAARARALLDCNHRRYDYAQYPDATKSQLVRNDLNVVCNTLNAIILDSLAAFGLIKRDPGAMTEEWSVLAALFHSEVCASGTTADVSYGMARAFDAFFSRGPGLRWRWLFQLISTHNQGRGWNHQRNHVECIRLLVPLLERFDSDVEDANCLPLAVRLVLFPAVFTLADSLKDCHRTTEAAWWLRRARDRREPSPYWKARLDVELSSLADLEGQVPFAKECTKPKLMNQKQHLIYLTSQRQISNEQKTKDLAECTAKWAEALAWTVRWHEGDPINLLGTIQGAAQSIHTVSTALKERFSKNERKTYEICLDNIIRALESLRQAIQHIPDPNPVFKFLSPQNASVDPDLKPRHAINTWKALKWLMPALEAVIEFRGKLRDADLELGESDSDSILARWMDTLRRRLREAWQLKRFADAAADQHIFKLLENPETLCPSDPAQHRRNCGNSPNCVAKALQLGDSSHESDVASTDYLLSRMSRTDAEFTRFLEDPSLELAHDLEGPVTPWTEFISLRRWNSFSPNLASRATTTVGGGYLIRVWKKNLRKYVGIAIDPGYNYLENLFDEGFTLPDVHVIVVTHAHPDHVENLSNILTLLREREKRIRRTSRVSLVLTEGVLQRFRTLFDNEIDFIHDIVVLSWATRPNRDTVHVVPGGQENGWPISLIMGDAPTSLVSIQAVRAIHADGTEFDSMGVVLRVTGQEGHQNLSVGFTGDTCYTSELCVDGKFAECDVLIPHLGSVINNEAFRNLHESWRLCEHKERLKKAVQELQPTLSEKNHLYLPGIAMLLCDIQANSQTRPPLILLSEFGEELRGGLRADLATRLNRIFEMTVLPTDVGLRVGVEDRSVRCAVCRQYVSADIVRPVAVSDEDEALVFVCNDCYRARQHELPILLGQLRNMPHPPQMTPRE